MIVPGAGAAANVFCRRALHHFSRAISPQDSGGAAEKVGATRMGCFAFISDASEVRNGPGTHISCVGADKL